MNEGCETPYLTEYVVRANGDTIYVDGVDQPFVESNNEENFNRLEEIAGDAFHIMKEYRNGQTESELDLDGWLFHINHYIRVLIEEGHEVEGFDSDYQTAILVALFAIHSCSFPIAYVLMLARIMQDSGSQDAVLYFAKTVLAMDGKINR